MFQPATEKWWCSACTICALGVSLLAVSAMIAAIPAELHGTVRPNFSQDGELE